MAQPTNKKQFKDYILRRLGYPVQQINLDDEQIYDRIDDAVQYWQEYHNNATEHIYYKHRVTTQDIANKYIDIPDDIISISKVFPPPTTSVGMASSTLFNIQYYMTAEAVLSAVTDSIIPYFVAMTRLADIQNLFDNSPGVRFERHLNTVKINMRWTDLQPGQYLVFEGEQLINSADVWSDWWLKDYATALVKRQWGEVLKLFSGVQLLGGITLDGQTIFNEAQAEIDALKSSMIKGFATPLLDEIA